MHYVISNCRPLINPFRFHYLRDDQTLLVMSPQALHEIVNDAVVKVCESSALNVDPHQTVLIDRNRTVAPDDTERQMPDGIVSIKYEKTFKVDNEDMKVVNLDDVFVIQVSDSQSIKLMVGEVRGEQTSNACYTILIVLNVATQLRKAMADEQGGPVLFIGVNTQEDSYLEHPEGLEHPHLNSDGFIPGAGAANNVLCTGFKRNNMTLLGRIKATLFVFLRDDLDKLSMILDQMGTANDWRPWVKGGFATVSAYPINALLQKLIPLLAGPS